MKKSIIFLIIYTTMFTVSCDTDKFLDQPLQGRQQLDDFFSTSSSAETFVNGIYQLVNGTNWNQVNFQRQINEMASDDNWAGNTRQPRPDITGIAQYNVFPGSTYFNLFWENHYIGITRANISLDRIPEVDIEEEKKQQFIAEAKFLRAFFYFDLVRNFGGVPIVTTYN